MSSTLRVAVLGTGALGKEHARIYAELAQPQHLDFVGVYDVNAEAARKVAERYRVRAFTSAEEAATDSAGEAGAAGPAGATGPDGAAGPDGAGTRS